MKFIKIPFIPEKKISHAIIDCRAPKNVLKSMKNMGITPILSPKSKHLYDAVSSHPDMLIHPLGNNLIVVAAEVYNDLYALLKPLGYKIILGKSAIKRNYPENVAYNVARIDKFAFHNIKYTDKTIREYFEKEDIKIIDVKQGYAKCSTCIVGKKAIITSDRGIARAGERYDIDVLFIKPGFIQLPGLNYGFIGGATGLISPDTLAVAGNLKIHPDYEKIVDFCNKYSVNVLCLTEENVIDIGSIIPLCCGCS